jgi:hypothetical protein
MSTWSALFLALASGFLFGAVPVRQILRTNPYEVVKAGSTGIIAGSTPAGGFRLRDVVAGGADCHLCAVLVTSSLVAVRGLMRSMHSNFGFEPEERDAGGYSARTWEVTAGTGCRPCRGA